MKLKNLEEALHQAPFVPFQIRLDGREIPVEHPDQVLFSHSRDTVVVAGSDDRLHILEVAEIKLITMQRRARQAKAA